MKACIFGALCSGGYFFVVDEKYKNFYDTLYHSWFTLIRNNITTYLELKQINLKEFYKLWEAARQFGLFDKN